MAFEFVAGQNPDTNKLKSHNARLTWNHTSSTRARSSISRSGSTAHSLLVPEPVSLSARRSSVLPTKAWVLAQAFLSIAELIDSRHAVLYRRLIGNHLFSAGGEVDRLQNNGLESSSERGNYYFRADFGRDAITNFRMGIASRYSAAIGDGHRGFRWFEQQFLCR